MGDTARLHRTRLEGTENLKTPAKSPFLTCELTPAGGNGFDRVGGEICR